MSNVILFLQYKLHEDIGGGSRKSNSILIHSSSKNVLSHFFFDLGGPCQKCKDWSE